MIRFDSIAKRYPPDISALIDVSAEIAAGELVTIVGHSGAGKSTLLKLIPAIERPTSGAVLVSGQNVGALGRKALPFLRRNIGLVFQDQKLLFDRTALANVLLPLEITGFSRKDAQRRAEAALDKVGLLKRARALPIALSGGEQQRLAIARAVVHRPSLLLADEPTAYLDPDTARDVASIFLEFHRVGVTVLVATYDDSLFPGARRIHLDHGRLV
ncbi:MAG: ATP-binding cassette domain-containing protein [Gammaproteobacteria bacterium]|nr:ATP-binding cassette domain-containing protein [Rhodocyclaceae bacterium]MBU3909147.1 ATP-binding cassette domain-containing protein [Gammaproteobacteria bacterium]MBU3988344.1 ATP-binding cassette domain-containing protein [Gammaproteobacteria bacterium]MBU4005693.1 ATP-binding cassette domain-containing protein [Gammaproteobacteria bacterium]MBU4020754.1 ATP-binding cassette domain-containing protein [Gammaproteobacteria bacterium]